MIFCCVKNIAEINCGGQSSYVWTTRKLRNSGGRNYAYQFENQTVAVSQWSQWSKPTPL